MKIDFRNVRTRWINVDKDTNKADLMVEMLDTLGFKNHERFSAVTNVKPHEGVRKGEEHYRNCAESHFKMLPTLAGPLPALQRVAQAQFALVP